MHGTRFNLGQDTVGFRCLISGREFVAADANSKAAIAEAHRQQVAFSAQLAAELQAIRPSAELNISELQKLYQERQQAHE